MQNLSTGRVAVGERVKLVQRGNKKTWIAEFHRAGLHCRLSMRTANLKVARERAMELAVSLTNGTYRPAPAATTFEKAVEDHMSVLKADGKADGTLEKYQGIYTIWLKYLSRQGVVLLQQYAPTHYDRFRAERLQTRTPGTVYDDSNLIRCFFRWAKSRQLITVNPLEGIRIPRPQLMPKFCPSLEQVNIVLAMAPELLRPYWTTLAFTGMRAGELRQLRPMDLDLPGNWLNIVSRPGARTKTGKSRRVPIHPRLRAILESLPSSSRETLFEHPGRDGGEMEPVSLRMLNFKLQELLPRVSIPAGRATGFVVHSFRHFFESYCVNAGVPQPIVDRWLGHTPDPTVMANVYYTLEDKVSQEKMLSVEFPDTTGNLRFEDAVLLTR